MKTKKNKNNFSKNQEILCQVVDVFLKNGIHKNKDIVTACRNLNPDKLRGVKRSLTLKKRKSSKKTDTNKSTSLNKKIYFVPSQGRNQEMPMNQFRPVTLEDIIGQYILMNQVKNNIGI